MTCVSGRKIKVAKHFLRPDLRAKFRLMGNACKETNKNLQTLAPPTISFNGSFVASLFRLLMNPKDLGLEQLVKMVQTITSNGTSLSLRSDWT